MGDVLDGIRNALNAQISPLTSPEERRKAHAYLDEFKARY